MNYSPLELSPVRLLRIVGHQNDENVELTNNQLRQDSVRLESCSTVVYSLNLFSPSDVNVCHTKTGQSCPQPFQYLQSVMIR